MRNKNWFEVSKEGLKVLQAGKPKHFIIRELVQNAWDENITHCEVNLNYSKREAQIKVIDDSPEGFRDLADAFTLFKATYKRKEPEKRGRFNIGEKQAIALSDRAMISTTKGTIIFDKDGRRKTREKRDFGSEIILWVKMKKAEFDEIFKMIERYIPPENIKFVVNGDTQTYRKPDRILKTSLETEIEENNMMRKIQRKTSILIYRKTSDTAMLYELGIPICEIECQFDINVQQKVPLGIDRETIPQRYLNNLYAEVLNETYDLIEKDNSSDLWVREAMKNKRIKEKVIDDILHKRFGEKVVVANPFDPNANDEAISRGYNVVYGSELSKKEWENIKEYDLLKSSTELFGKDMVEAKSIDPNEKQIKVEKLAKKIAKRLLGIDLRVNFVKSKANCGADFGNSVLTFNVSRLGKYFWENPISKEVISLILHELGHSEGNHTEMSYHKCLTDMAGELTTIALKEPKFFDNV